METIYSNIKNDRQMRSSTGMTKKMFEKLLFLFKEAYETLEGASVAERNRDNVQELVFTNYADMLYLVLFYLKTGLTLDTIGVIYGKDGGQMGRFIEKYKSVLLKALELQDFLPKRSFGSVAEFQRYLQDEPELIIDATEVPIQRSKDKLKQQEHYSGKKKGTV
jgi:hypothetical protein